MTLTRRQQVLGGLLILTGVLTVAILARVLGTVFFAITIAYVLYPISRRLVDHGLDRRIAAAVATTVGFVVAVALVAPLAFILYARRQSLLDFLLNVPSEQPVSVLGFTYVVDVSDVLLRVQTGVTALAVDIARAAPVLFLKGILFLILVFALLLGGRNLHGAATRLVPQQYHDIVLSLHRRTRSTLYALYVLQAATAFVTFVAGYAVFTALGYDSAFALSILSGILQFIPILGPSLVIVALALVEVIAGDIAAAILVTVLGLLIVGFLPDALIRPRLASITTGLPASLYFVGFTGGTLTLGVVGIIAGPLVVALLVEVTELVTQERNTDPGELAESSLLDEHGDDVGVAGTDDAQ